MMASESQRTQHAGRDEKVVPDASSILRPVQAQKVYVIAANQIVAHIKAGYWPSGSRLPSERELSDILGISRSSVRQALVTLESIGIVRSKRGVGHFITDEAVETANSAVVDSLMSEGDPQELLEARRIVEPEIARLAAVYRDSEDLEKLYDVIDRMQREEENEDFSRYLNVDFQFHYLLALATHNPVMIDIERVIIERMKAPPWQAATYTIVPNIVASNREEHVRVVDAVAARKPKQARQAMIAHLASIARNLRNISAFAGFDI